MNIGAQALDARGFYDKDKTGQTRAVRNDLGGSLPAMVQFAQSHTVDPSGNAAKEMPMLTTQREALLLVTPDPSLNDIRSMQVTVIVDGESKGVLQLRHPDAIFRSDYAATDGRADYVYSRRAWSVVLPWDWVRPGLELQVSDDQRRFGNLAPSAIDFAAPAELVVNNIRIGMLTTPEVNDSSHWFRARPAEAAADYFQTIPAARLTAAYYEDVMLPRVMVASGVIYDTASAGAGNVYGGDMRENTGKATFSVGINLANFGVTSSGMQSQRQPQVFQNVVVHHARGVYSNGVHSHGLSGGNGMLTLYTSRGNEFSHEIGHHYGLGHYPGQNGTNYFWAAHHHDSGWGFIGHRKRMRSNLLWHRDLTGGLGGVPVLDETYRFAPDSMAGGDFSSSLSQYTHYTGYSTKRAIQPNLDKPIPTPESPTGYRKWNANTRAMENHAPAIPNEPTVWFNSANGMFLAPRLHGVPVVTLLGGYDPEANNALIYPALRSNWGNVFTLPTQAVAANEPRQCWLDVAFAGNAPTQRIALAGKRMQPNLVNKLHVNLAQSDKPSEAKLWCQTPAQPAQLLYTLAIPHDLPPMPPPAIIGKSAGYEALRKIELPQLETALLGLATKKVLVLSTNARTLYDSHAEAAAQLSPAAQVQLRRYAEQQQQALRLNRWMSAYDKDLSAQVPQALTALDAFIRELNFSEQPRLPLASTMTMANGNCIQKSGAGVRVAGKALCEGSANDQWVVDGRGAIRSQADLGLCLTDQGNNKSVTLTACDVSKDNQAWDLSVAQRVSRFGRCLDLNRGALNPDNTGTLITYGCSNAANQQWAGLVANENLLLTMVSNANVRHLSSLSSAVATAQRKAY